MICLMNLIKANWEVSKATLHTRKKSLTLTSHMYKKSGLPSCLKSMIQLRSPQKKRRDKFHYKRKKCLNNQDL